MQVENTVGLRWQLYALLRNLILDGRVGPGTRLASSRSIAYELGLSALTPLHGQQDCEVLTLLARALLLPAVHRPLAVRRVVGRLATQHKGRAPAPRP